MSLLQWLFRRKPEPEGVRDLLYDLRDRMKGVERDVKGLEGDYADLRDDLQKRFGRVWSRLKSSQSDEPEEGEGAGSPPARPSIQELRTRFLSRRGG